MGGYQKNFGVLRRATRAAGRFLLAGRIRVAATLAGLAAAVSLIVGVQERNAYIIVIAIGIGVATALPVVLVEGSLRLLARNVAPSSQPKDPPRWRIDLSAHRLPEAVATFHGRAKELADLL